MTAAVNLCSKSKSIFFHNHVDACVARVQSSSLTDVMSPSHHIITVGSPFGVIWNSGRPEVQDGGLLTAVQLPQSDVKFVQCDISSAADIVATITTKGVVHLFHTKKWVVPASALNLSWTPQPRNKAR